MILQKYLKDNKTILKFLSSSLLAVPISLITGFITFRKIDPYSMGIWGTLTIFESYSNFLRLGIVNGMNRELPYALGAGNHEKAIKYAETTYSYTAVNIGILLTLIPIFVFKFKSNELYLATLGVVATRVVLSFYTTYISGTFRSDDQFNKLSNIQFIILVLTLVLCPLVLLGYHGYLIYQLLLVISNTILLHYFRPFHLKPKFHRIEFAQLFKIGFPIFITSYLVTIIDTFPRLYIVKYGNEKLMGLYAPILMLLGTVSLLPNVLATYLYPKFSFRLGKSNDAKGVWKRLIKLYTVSIAFISVLIIGAFFLLDYFISFFPKYSESLPYLKLSLFICPFVMYKLGNMLNAIFKNYRYMILYVIIYGLVQVATIIIGAYLLSDVLKIAIYSQIVTAILLFAISLIFNYRMVFKNDLFKV